MIQITEEKKEKLTEMCEKMLRYGGKMMQCLESLDEEDEERMPKIGYRFDDEYEEPDTRIGHGGIEMRSGRSGMRSGMGGGRYRRF